MPNPIDVHQGPTYMVWVDSSKKIATSTKITNALTHFRRKHRCDPVEIIVHESVLGTKSEVPLRAERFVNQNYFYLPIPDT